ncbi:MAG: alpha-1,6-mannosyltransferase [Polaribacter sp.]|jgi:alpha-1,6-mannosyltransferase
MSLFNLYRNPLLFVVFTSFFYLSFAYDLERTDFIKLISLYTTLFFLFYKKVQIFKTNFWLLAGLGIFFRLLFITSIPNLSQDFYRFLWDGRLVFQGINPYLISPEMYLSNGNLVVAQAQLLYEGMGALNGSHFSNYPPVNQLLFSIAALFSGKSILGSVVVLRIIIILADIGVLFFGRKLLKQLNLDESNIFWYFLNPFIIIELTGNLHFEGVMLFFIIASLYYLYKRKWIIAAILLGLSVSVKLIPLLFLPLLFQWFMKNKSSARVGFSKLVRFYLLTLATIILSFAPFYSNEFLINFTNTIGLWFQDFEFNASVYYIIRWIGFKAVGWNLIGSVGKILPMVTIAFIFSITFFRKNNKLKQLITAFLIAISFYFLLSTTVHPWYVATPLLLSVFTKYRFPLVWSFVVILSYSAYGSEGFSENLWFIALEYSAVIGFFLWEVFLKDKHQKITTK